MSVQVSDQLSPRSSTVADLFFPPSILDIPCATMDVTKIRLECYASLLDAAADAITALLDSRFSALDPIVGECRCETRALRLVELVERLQQSLDVKLLLINDLNIVRRMAELTRGRIGDATLADRTLREALIKGELNCSLSDEAQHAYRCFVLTLIKRRDDDNLDRTDFRKLPSFYEKLSTSLCRSIIPYYQRALAASSVGYLQKTADRWNEGDQVSTTARLDSRDRPVTPGLLGQDYIIRTLAMDRRDVVVRLHLMLDREIVKTVCLHFRGNGFLNFVFVGDAQSTLSRVEGHLPCYVIEACRVIEGCDQIEEAKLSVTQLDLRRAILAFFSHKFHYPMSQEPDGHLVPEALERERRALAKLPGYSAENPLLFSVPHTFALSVEEVLSERVPPYPLPTRIPKPSLA